MTSFWQDYRQLKGVMRDEPLQVKVQSVAGQLFIIARQLSTKNTAYRCGYSTGSSILKFAPSPGLLSAHIWPLWFSTTFCTMLSPTPDPE